jgi:hypothetical protein
MSSKMIAGKEGKNLKWMLRGVGCEVPVIWVELMCYVGNAVW